MGVTSTYEATVTATVRVRVAVAAGSLGEANDVAAVTAADLLNTLHLPAGVTVETVSDPTDVTMTSRGIPDDQTTFLGYDTAAVARFINSPALNEDNADLAAIAVGAGLPEEAGPVIANTSGLVVYTGDSWRWRFTPEGRDFNERYGIQ